MFSSENVASSASASASASGSKQATPSEPKVPGTRAKRRDPDVIKAEKEAKEEKREVKRKMKERRQADKRDTVSGEERVDDFEWKWTCWYCGAGISNKSAARHLRDSLKCRSMRNFV